MADHAISESRDVQTQLDRLEKLSPGGDVLGLERISALADRLGNPERALPPVFHVAGTNGKGSTCAFLRAAAEAAGLKAHVYTSPHLVRFNERIRIAGRLIDDRHLAKLLAEVLEAAGDINPTFFEATTAAAFLAFARERADLCIIEVGCGGRLDATNIVPAPAVCGIAQLGLDHQAMLGSTLEQIAFEKAGIAKVGVPLVTEAYPSEIAARIQESAEQAGAPWFPRGSDWESSSDGERLLYRDHSGAIELPIPRLEGEHQAMNAGLAIALLRHQGTVRLAETALRTAMTRAEWPARLQRMADGPLHRLLPAGAELWLDGAHNPSAARPVADFFSGHIAEGRPFHIVLGMLDNKDPAGVLEPFDRVASLYGVPVPSHAHHSPEALAAAAKALGIEGFPARNVENALAAVTERDAGAEPPIVLILGSLYLAGEVLRSNGQVLN